MPRKGKQPERNDREKNDSNEQPPPKPRTNKDEDGNHIKRPLNAFVLWAQARRPVLMGENPGVLVPKISPLLGKEWRLLPAEEKALWRKKQQEEKERHAEANPDYVYQPRSSAQVQADKNRRGGNKNKRKAQESEDGEDEKVAHVPASARPRKRSRKAKVAVNKPGEFVVSTPNDFEAPQPRLPPSFDPVAQNLDHAAMGDATPNMAMLPPQSVGEQPPLLRITNPYPNSSSTSVESSREPSPHRAFSMNPVHFHTQGPLVEQFHMVPPTGNGSSEAFARGLLTPSYTGDNAGGSGFLPLPNAYQQYQSDYQLASPATGLTQYDAAYGPAPMASFGQFPSAYPIPQYRSFAENTSGPGHPLAYPGDYSQPAQQQSNLGQMAAGWADPSVVNEEPYDPSLYSPASEGEGSLSPTSYGHDGFYAAAHTAGYHDGEAQGQLPSTSYDSFYMGSPTTGYQTGEAQNAYPHPYYHPQYGPALPDDVSAGHFVAASEGNVASRNIVRGMGYQPEEFTSHIQENGPTYIGDSAEYERLQMDLQSVGAGSSKGSGKGKGKSAEEEEY